MATISFEEIKPNAEAATDPQVSLYDTVRTAREQLNDLVCDESLDDDEEKLRTAIDNLLPEIINRFDAALNAATDPRVGADIDAIIRRRIAEFGESAEAAIRNVTMLTHVELAAKQARIQQLVAQLAEANAALEYRVEITPDDLLATMLARAEEAEAQLAEANARAEQWRLAAEEGSWPFEWRIATEYKERAERAEADATRLKTENEWLKEESAGNNHWILDLQADAARLREANVRMHEDIEALECATDRLRGALEAIEWGVEPDGQCPYCLQTKLWASGEPWGHTSGCVIGKALRAPAAPAEGEAKEQIKRLEAERDAANMAAEKASQTSNAALETCEMLAEANEELGQRLLAAQSTLVKVEAYMASEDGPLCKLWEDGDIANYDDVPPTDWEQTLFDIRDWKHGCVPMASLGYGTEWPVIVLYREILAALEAPEAAQEVEE